MPLLERRSFIAAVVGTTFPLGIQRQSRSSSPVAPVRKGEDRLGESHTIGVSSAAFKVLTAESGGAVFVMENSMTRKGGPPRHLHHEQDEWFYVVRGEFVFEIGSDRFRLGPGDSILGPRKVPHAYAFAGADAGQLLIAYAPAGRMEEFFRGRREGAQYSTDAARYREYGMELLGPPLQLE